jgi:cell division protein DivIC
MGRKNSKRKQSKLCTFVILVSLALLAGIVLCKSVSLREQKNDLAVQAAELQEQIAEADEEYQELEEREEYMKTKKYVEEVARNQLGLVYPDEIVIRPEE